jgi:hypothetical protein
MTSLIDTGEPAQFTADVVPASSNTNNLGSGTAQWANLFLGASAVVNYNNGADTVTYSAGALAFTTNIVPANSNANDLGASTEHWRNLFFGASSVINYNNGTATVTYSPGQLAFAVLDLVSSTPNNLGSGIAPWQNLFLGSTAAINFNNGAATITYGNNEVTLAGLGVTLAVGTTTLAPLIFQSGALLTTGSAGASECDGTCFYQTAVRSARQVIDCEQFISLSVSQTASGSGVAGSAAQTWFPGGGATTLTCAGSTTYMFEGELHLANGTTSHTTATLFTGSANIQSITYSFNVHSVAVNTVGVPSAGGCVTQASSTILNGTSVAAGAHVKVRGMVRIAAGGGGTFAPQFQWSTGPLGPGPNQVLANTFFRIWAVGNNNVLNVGNWA